MNAVSDLLLKLGIHKTCKGFRYLVFILQLCLEDEDYLLHITSLYEATGKKFNTAADNIESCIRTAIANCWKRGNRRYLIQITRYNLERQPSAGEFLDILYCHLKSQEN